MHIKGLVIYDDYQSIIHTILGFVVTMLHLNSILLPVYIVYQVVEYMFVHDNLCGDIVEYITGAGIYAIIESLVL